MQSFFCFSRLNINILIAPSSLRTSAKSLRPLFLISALLWAAVESSPTELFAATKISNNIGATFELKASTDNDTPEFDDSPRATFNHHPAWFSDTFLNLPDDLAAAQDKGKQGIIVYFGQKHCAYCEALLDINFKQEQDIVRYTRENFDLISLDIWGSRMVTDFDGNTLEEKDLAEFEDTNFTPSMIFYTEVGTEALRLRGYYPPYKFRGALKYVTEEYYKTETFSEYMARANHRLNLI